MAIRHALPQHQTPWHSLPGMVLLLAPDGTALHVSTAYARFAGLPGGAAPAPWDGTLEEGSRGRLRAALATRRDFALALQFETGTDRQAWCHCDAHWLAETGQFVCLLHDTSEARAADRSARSSAERLRLLAEHMPAQIAYYDAASFRCVFANRHYAEAFGLTAESIVGCHFTEIIGADAALEVAPQVDLMLTERRAVSYERTLVRGDGSTRWIKAHIVPQLADDGAAVGAFVLLADITHERLVERSVRESEERLAKFMQASAEGIVFHKDGFIADANPPLCRLLGRPLEEVLGRHILEFIPPDQVERVQAVMRSGAETTYESAILDHAGQRIDVELIVRSLLRNGERLRMAIVRDIRDRRSAQARIHYLAHHDPLTGLPNRSTFVGQVETLLGAGNGAPLALLFVDLDNFKRVNDSLGHLAGDELLRTVAARITAALRGTDLVGRFGGDEFMVLLPEPMSRPQVEEVARKLLAAIHQPIVLERRRIAISASIGIAIFPGDGRRAVELLEHADSAMYLAKTRGRGNCQFFDPARNDIAYAELVMEGELVEALRLEQFDLHFQPMVAARDGTLVGVEALLRWSHPRYGLVLPDQFISVAEQQRLTLPLGNWVLRQALRRARQWQVQRRGPAVVAVNLSNLQFHSDGLVEGLRRLLREEQADGGLLELEISERTLLDDLADVRQRLVELKSMGLRISVDDFGTGYFSPRHLTELPVDRIKLDRSFVRDLPHNRESAAVARAIIQMADGLGKPVIAEGVESEAQCHFLAQLGCAVLQGNAISPPLAAGEIERWIAAADPTAATAAWCAAAIAAQ